MVPAVHEVPQLRRSTAARSGRRPELLGAAAGLGGGALAVLVGADGSAGWQVLRVAAVAALTSLVVAAQVRLPVRWAGRVAIAAGTPAIGVAVGFAPYWSKGGALPTRAAAAVLTAAGLALTVGGTVLATRGRGLARRATGGVVTIVAVVLVTVVLGPAVAASNVPRPALGATPASVGLAYEDVTLRTADGVSLAAWYVRSSNRAAVVLLHGAGSTRSDVLDEAAVIAPAGYGVLMVDARGHGESGGQAMDFGWHGDADIRAATAYLASRDDIDRHRIGAVGMSMGGEQALGASGTNDLIRAVVAEGATARSAADEAWLSDEYGFRGALQELLERLQDRITDTLTSASVPVSSRAAAEASLDTRYLLITAGSVRDEAHAAAHVAEGAPDRVETWNVPGAAHTGGLQTAPDEWARRVVAFLDETLSPDAPAVAAG